MAVSHCAVPPAQSASVSTLKGPSSPSQRTTGMDNTRPNGHKEGHEDQHQQHSTASSSSSPSSSPSPPPSLFTPIWDYDRFPVGPCVRRLSQEQQNPFLIDYSQQQHLHHRSQSSSASSSRAMMRSASSSSSTGDATAAGTSPVPGPHSRRGSRHYESKHGGRNVNGGQSVLGGGGSVGSCSGMVVGASHGLPTGTSALNGVVSFSCSPSSAYIPHTHPHAHTCTGVATAVAAADADAAASQEHPPQPESSSSRSSSPPAAISKFDQYIAQKERIRSTRASTTSLSSSSGRGPATAINTTATTTTTNTPSPASASASASYHSGPNSAASSPTLSPAKKTGSFFPRLFKSKSKNKKAHCDRRTDPSQPQPHPPLQTPSGTRSHDSTRHETLPSSPGSCSSSSRSSLLQEKEAHFSTRPPSTSDPEKNVVVATAAAAAVGRINTTSASAATATVTVGSSQSPIQEQQDRWRDEWLRPSGAIHSMFRDRPAKFNCPHCGAIKVVSHIQFVPGVMSYLVAFGLLFLTLGTLSYLPFRRDHEGTKDCLHWCPECGHKVARFNRANSTWEWI